MKDLSSFHPSAPLTPRAVAARLILSEYAKYVMAQLRMRIGSRVLSDDTVARGTTKG